MYSTEAWGKLTREGDLSKFIIQRNTPGPLDVQFDVTDLVIIIIVIIIVLVNVIIILIVIILIIVVFDNNLSLSS